jgi:hypothetical protein
MIEKDKQNTNVNLSIYLHRCAEKKLSDEQGLK